MITLLISGLAFYLGMYEGNKIINDEPSITLALYERAKEIAAGDF